MSFRSDAKSLLALPITPSAGWAGLYSTLTFSPSLNRSNGGRPSSSGRLVVVLNCWPFTVYETTTVR